MVERGSLTRVQAKVVQGREEIDEEVYPTLDLLGMLIGVHRLVDTECVYKLG